jgi:hypothetical protein
MCRRARQLVLAACCAVAVAQPQQLLAPLLFPAPNNMVDYSSTRYPGTRSYSVSFANASFTLPNGTSLSFGPPTVSSVSNPASASLLFNFSLYNGLGYVAASCSTYSMYGYISSITGANNLTAPNAQLTPPYAITVMNLPCPMAPARFYDTVSASPDGSVVASVSFASNSFSFTTGTGLYIGNLTSPSIAGSVYTFSNLVAGSVVGSSLAVTCGATTPSLSFASVFNGDVGNFTALLSVADACPVPTCPTLPCAQAPLRDIAGTISASAAVLANQTLTLSFAAGTFSLGPPGSLTMYALPPAGLGPAGMLMVLATSLYNMPGMTSAPINIGYAYSGSLTYALPGGITLFVACGINLNTGYSGPALNATGSAAAAVITVPTSQACPSMAGLFMDLFGAVSSLSP